MMVPNMTILAHPQLMATITRVRTKGERIREGEEEGEVITSLPIGNMCRIHPLIIMHPTMTLTITRTIINQFQTIMGLTPLEANFNINMGINHLPIIGFYHCNIKAPEGNFQQAHFVPPNLGGTGQMSLHNKPFMTTEVRKIKTREEGEEAGEYKRVKLQQGLGFITSVVHPLMKRKFRCQTEV